MTDGLTNMERNEIHTVMLADGTINSSQPNETNDYLNNLENFQEINSAQYCLAFFNKSHPLNLDFINDLAATASDTITVNYQQCLDEFQLAFKNLLSQKKINSNPGLIKDQWKETLQASWNQTHQIDQTTPSEIKNEYSRLYKQFKKKSDGENFVAQLY